MSIVDRLVEIVATEDIEGFGALYAEDAVLYEPLLVEPAVGRSAIVEGEAALFEAFSDVSVTVKNELRSDAVVVAEVVLSATNDGPLNLGAGEVPPTGRRIEVPMVWVFELDDDEVVTQERDYFDTALIMRQLGLDGT